MIFMQTDCALNPSREIEQCTADQGTAQNNMSNTQKVETEVMTLNGLFILSHLPLPSVHLNASQLLPARLTCDENT